MTSLDRAFDVLEYVARGGDVRVGDICNDMKLPRPTAHRLLTVLVARGYLEHDPVAHVYRTGWAAAVLTARTTASRLIVTAETALARLREASGETANLGVLRGGRIHAATVDGVRFPRMSISIGEDVPPHATAIGKAILAALPVAERGRLLGPEPYPRYTEHTFTTRSEIDSELELTVERGFAIDAEEVDAGAVCVAAAIRDHAGLPIAGISVSATTSRLGPAARNDLGRLVIKWCDHISTSLAAAV